MKKASEKNYGGRPTVSKGHETRIVAFKTSDFDKSRLVAASSLLGFPNVSELLRNITSSWLSWFEEKNRKKQDIIQP